MTPYLYSLKSDETNSKNTESLVRHTCRAVFISRAVWQQVNTIWPLATVAVTIQLSLHLMSLAN